MSNCYSCKHCKPGVYQFWNEFVDEGTLVCELTGNALVEPNGTEVNTTACEHYKNDFVTVGIENIDMQPLPF